MISITGRPGAFFLAPTGSKSGSTRRIGASVSRVPRIWGVGRGANTGLQGGFGRIGLMPSMPPRTIKASSP